MYKMQLPKIWFSSAQNAYTKLKIEFDCQWLEDGELPREKPVRFDQEICGTASK